MCSTEQPIWEGRIAPSQQNYQVWRIAMYAPFYEWNRLNAWGRLGRIYRNLNTGEYAEESNGMLVPITGEGIVAVCELSAEVSSCNS